MNSMKMLLSRVNNFLYRRIMVRFLRGIMEEDWDNLIILDSCRYDVFKETVRWDGKCKYKISKGSCTRQFLLNNFSNGVFLDTVYITANPHVDKFVSKSFYHVISVWRNHWDEKLGTVKPEDVVKESIKVLNEFKDKRIIIHFVQPHYPYLGEKGITYNHLFRGITGKGIFDQEKNKPVVYELIKNKFISKEEIIEIYRENLEIVLEQVELLLPHLQGKTVVTSDHGESFGGRGFPFPVKIYGHPCGTFCWDLIKVPWFEIYKGARKTIRRAQRAKIEEKTSELNNEELKSKLRALGYY